MYVKHSLFKAYHATTVCVRMSGDFFSYYLIQSVLDGSFHRRLTYRPNFIDIISGEKDFKQIYAP